MTRSMNRSSMGVIAAAIAGTALVAGLRAQERQTLRAMRPDAGGPGRVVFTFKDDNQMRAFANLWNQRERSMARLGTLQEYWAQEQRDLAQTQQRLSDYRVDPARSYVLDPQHKVLIETERSERSALRTPASK